MHDDKWISLIRDWRSYFQKWQIENLPLQVTQDMDLLEDLFPLMTFRDGRHSAFGNHGPIEAWLWACCNKKEVLKVAEYQHMTAHVRRISNLDPPPFTPMP